MNKLNEKGQSLVLFIILLPVLLLMLVGIIDLGVVYATNYRNETIIENVLMDAFKKDNRDSYIINNIKMNIKNINNFSLNGEEIINLEVSVSVKGIFNIINENTNYKYTVYSDEKNDVVLKKEK